MGFVGVRTTEVEATTAFLHDVLGLDAAPRRPTAPITAQRTRTIPALHGSGGRVHDLVVHGIVHGLEVHGQSVGTSVDGEATLTCQDRTMKCR
jgi:hypothetical protein